MHDLTKGYDQEREKFPGILRPATNIDSAFGESCWFA